jgi:ABC-2 type transport system ATP-binding protein
MSIRVTGLSKRFGPRKVVTDVSFTIPAVGLVGLIGPNGAGKTTILRVLTTFLPPCQGTVEVGGFDCRTAPAEVRRQVGYLPESPPPYADARVVEYLTFRARQKQISRRQRSQEITRCLEACQLREVGRRLLGRLSHGYRRRVGLADALLGSPPVLLLDEPTIGLDPLQVVHLRNLLQELSDRCTVLLSTHLLAEAQQVCQRALMLVHGRVAADIDLTRLPSGTATEAELRGDPVRVQAALQALPGASTVRQISSDGDWQRWSIVSESGEDLREATAAICSQQRWPLRELTRPAQSLEEQFVAIATRQEASP